MSTSTPSDLTSNGAAENGSKPLREERIRSEQLLDGQLLKVYRDEVSLPDGKASKREWIDHPGASAVVPLFEDGSTVLLRQFRYAAGHEFLEVPAGKLDEAEDAPEEVARRELEEEAGLLAHTLHHVGTTYPAIGYSNEVIHLFVGEDLERTAPDREEGEFMEVVPLGFEEALEQMRAGKIKDAKTVAALTLAESFIRRRAREAEEKKLR